MILCSSFVKLLHDWGGGREWKIWQEKMPQNMFLLRYNSFFFKNKHSLNDYKHLVDFQTSGKVDSDAFFFFQCSLIEKVIFGGFLHNHF